MTEPQTNPDDFDETVPAVRELRFLIVGMARSGTTVLQRMVSELPGVFVPPETHFWRHAGALADQYELPLSADEARRAIDWFLARDSSAGLELDAAEVVEDLGHENFLWGLFEAIVAGLSPRTASVLGEKTPDHVRWAMQLMGAQPELRVVGIIRDPREVLRSHRDVPWGINNPWMLSEKWLEHVRILSDLERFSPDRVKVMRYEDIVADPHETRGALAEFLGVGDEEGAADTSETDLFLAGEWWKRGALNEIRVQPDRWPEALSDEDITVVEWRTQDGLELWDYPLSGNGTPPGTPPLELVIPIRSAGLRAALNELPIDAASLRAWQSTDRQIAARTQERAQGLASEVKRLRDWLEREKAAREALKERYDDAVEWKKHAQVLARNDAQWRKQVEGLEATVDLVEQRLDDQKAKTQAWKQRAEINLAEEKLVRQQLIAERRRRLAASKKRLVAESNLARIKARRWWRLGGVLGRLRRSPLRIDRGVREMLSLAQASQLPPAPDTSDIDERIAGLDRQLKASRSSLDGLAEARTEFKEGSYERALELLDASPDRHTRSAHLLARDCYSRLGEVTAALGEVKSVLRVKDEAPLRLQARLLEGRLRETDTSWRPPLPMSPNGDVSTTEQKILHILKESLPFYERGYTIRSRSTLLAQRESGFEPVVVTSLGFPRDQGFEDFEGEELIDGIRHYRLDLGPAYEASKLPFDVVLTDQAAMTLDVATQERPRLIQAGSGYRGYETALVGMAVARKLDIPFVYEIRSFLEHTWTAEFDRSEQGEYYHRRFAQEVRCLTEADVVITIAEQMRAEIVARGVDADKVFVVPNVVDMERFTPRHKRLDLLDRYDLGDRPVLGYISNLGRREGIDNLIRAVHILRSQGNDIAGLVVGDGPEMPYLQDLVAKLGLDSHFVLTGHVANQEIEDHYALIDVFVVPRIDDRAARMVTPLKPLEAMSMRIPLVVADLPALRELAPPDERGLVFTPSEPAELARQVERLLGDDALAETCAGNAYEWVSQERTQSSNARRYAEILGRLTTGISG